MMRLEDKKIAILADTDSEDYEIWYVLMRMLEEGADVFVMGAMEVRAYSNQNKDSVRMDVQLSVVLAPIFNAVIIPGCYSPHWLSHEAMMSNLVESALKRGDLVGMICETNWLPISSRILKGRKVASSKMVRPALISAGATWVDERVVRDGNLISSRSRDDLDDFCRVIIDQLVGQKAGLR